MFFDPRRYDLAKVGRYKFNKKLALRNRITGAKLAEDVVDMFTGEVVASAGEKVSLSLADKIQNTGVAYVYVSVPETDRPVKVLTNQTVELSHFFPTIDADEVGIKDTVYYPALVRIIEEFDDEEDIKKALIERHNELVPRWSMSSLCPNSYSK